MASSTRRGGGGSSTGGNSETDGLLADLARVIQENTRAQREGNRASRASPEGRLQGNRTVIPGFGSFGEFLGPTRRGNQDRDRSLLFGRGAGAIANRAGFELGGAKLITGLRAGGVFGGAAAMAVGGTQALMNANAAASSPFMTQTQKNAAFYDSLASAVPFGSAYRKISKDASGVTQQLAAQERTLGDTSSLASSLLKHGITPNAEVLNFAAGHTRRFHEQAVFFESRVIPGLENVAKSGDIFPKIAKRKAELEEQLWGSTAFNTPGTASGAGRRGGGPTDQRVSASAEAAAKIREAAEILERGAMNKNSAFWGGEGR